MAGLCSTLRASKRADERHNLPAAFLYPNCRDHIRASFSTPLTVFVAEKDDANPPPLCRRMEEYSKETGQPVDVAYLNAFHAYDMPGGFRVFRGWRLKFDALATETTRRRVIEQMLSAQ